VTAVLLRLCGAISVAGVEITAVRVAITVKIKNNMMNETNNEKMALASGFTSEEVALIKATVAKGTTDLELALFLQVAKSYELSPFKKEIWCYKDGQGNVIIFAGRDGHLAAAQKDRRWSGIASSEVRENDVFKMDIPNGIIQHTFAMNGRGAIVGAYAIARPKGCDIQTVEWVAFDAYNKGYATWKSDPAAMIKKVAETHCLKKAYGLSGLASEYDFDIVDDKAYPKDLETAPDIKRISYAENLIRSSCFDHERQAQLEKDVRTMTNSELDELLDVLKINQLDPVHEAGNYSQTDLKKL
jgi:recombinational DNA repair protein RecT